MKRTTQLKAKKPMRKVSVKQAAKRKAAGEDSFGSTIRPTVRTSKGKAPRYIGPDAASVDAVLERDGHSCVVCGGWLEPYQRGRSWSIHHRRRIRTDNRLSNLIAVCGGAAVSGCHQEIHDNVAKARQAGWLVKRTDNPAEKVMASAQRGWGYPTDDGGWIPAPEQEACA